MREPVYMVRSYHDAPRTGIADYKGRPHWYESRFDHAKQQYDDIYQLRPVDAETFQLSLEARDIFLRWERAFRDGLTTIDTHPSLPPEHGRWDVINNIILDRVNGLRDPPLLLRAEFEPGTKPEWVEWKRIGDAS